MIERYRTLCAELAALESVCDAAVADADRAALRAGDPAARDVAEAADCLRTAADAARRAARRVTQVDARAERIWAELRAFLGRRGDRLEDLPSPESLLEAGSADIVHDDPRAALDSASATIGRAANGEPVAPMPGWTLLVVPFIGFASAILVALPARGIFVTTASVAVQVLASILMFLAPVAGTGPVAWWIYRRFACRPDVGLLAMTAIGGMVASCAAVALVS